MEGRRGLCGGGAARRGVAAALAVALGVAPGASGQALATMSGETGEAIQEPAAAQPSAADLSAQAIERFQVQDYDAAVRLFEEAYAIDTVPNYLFNIGRVYEEKGDIRSAVDYYQRFVKEPGVEIEARELALQRLRVLRGVLQETDPEEQPKPEPAEATPPAAEGPRPEPQPEAPPLPPPPPDPKKLAGAGLLGAGAGWPWSAGSSAASPCPSSASSTPPTTSRPVRTSSAAASAWR